MEVFARWWNAKLAPRGLSIPSLSRSDLSDGHALHQLAAVLTGGAVPPRPSSAGEPSVDAVAALERVKASPLTIHTCTPAHLHPCAHP